MPEEIDAPIPAETNFDSDFDYKPLEESFFQKTEEKLFRLMSGSMFRKKNPAVKPDVKTVVIPEPVIAADDLFEEMGATEIIIPPSPIPVVKKSRLEQIKEKIHLPVIPGMKIISNGIALAVFAAGAYLMYSEIPTHPELVVGIVMVSVAGNILIYGR